MPKHSDSNLVAEPTAEDLARLKAVLARVGGRDVSWGAVDVLNLWLVEHRARLDQQMSSQIRSSSWALVLATVGLVLCTAGLIWATLA